ncbi:hypothetical protein NHX12_008415 [Muraenolepis orangiensis]|uniref:Uncharacterized protein n=1 Tax=Muraenolepis orangiensis TaxID=630683 RepID=A0A9Q0DJP7_9TELE|nr:hypothetical protein NHX12_008415 [Muraenolepis orangiensis]
MSTTSRTDDEPRRTGCEPTTTDSTDTGMRTNHRQHRHRDANQQPPTAQTHRHTATGMRTNNHRHTATGMRTYNHSTDTPLPG